MLSGRAEVLSTHTPSLFAAAVERAVAALGQGEVVALPTETVYGLAANALNSEAVARIFRIKGRPGSNPIIVHVASRALALRCAREWPALADRLAAAFWPGPLTLVVPRSDLIPDVVTAGGETVGIRWPQHPFMQAVIREADFPIAAPSANLSNQISPTSADHVARSLGDRLRLIVDGGDANVGLESTVVDLTSPVPRVLRPGMIALPDLERAAGVKFESAPRPGGGGGALRSPGLLPKHYAPRARLVVLDWSDESDLQRQLATFAVNPDKLWILAHSCVPLSGNYLHVCVIPDDPEAYARALYGELHRCDEAGAELIAVERPPEGPAWAAVADRLGRASA